MFCSLSSFPSFFVCFDEGKYELPTYLFFMRFSAFCVTKAFYVKNMHFSMLTFTSIAGKIVKEITNKIKRFLKMRGESPEVDCQTIGSKPVRTITYVEGAKPKRRTLQNRQESFVVTLPKSWIRRKIVGPWKGLDKTEVIIRQWRDPETGKFKGVIVEIAEKEAQK
jgi:hypothetical protein